ncbi:TetR/AcrR family transcriptional regulator [Agromyces archimandritae]|uniref:TetR/AcrR family transcriptional regulator n=1 Tax=Agromyces archimandritae TaxID=2781962 RepID=A0A975IPU2_9MICO|nr:TetR/AcrR family transcriptional regulator [Agromyces archimandritae]QTX05960.1 TetR/AcrR family transcriptional regulator [Agromyces archimandritae]
MTEQTTLTPGARKVLAAASELFYAEGIHAVGVDAVAHRAGVTKKTIYDRFGSKDALAVAYLRGRDDVWRAALDEALAAMPAGADRLLGFFDFAGTWSRERSPRGCSAINARAETGDDTHPIAREVAREKAWLLERLRELVREAGIRRGVDELADALMLLYEGALVTVGLDTFGDPFAAARTAAAALLAARSDR